MSKNKNDKIKPFGTSIVLIPFMYYSYEIIKSIEKLLGIPKKYIEEKLYDRP